MRGVILAGGNGTRLRPATKVTNKHLLPVIDTPMIMYPLNTLKSFGIKDILIVTGGNHIGAFAEYLGDGSDFGVRLTYKVQKEATGIAAALALAEDFVKQEGGHFMVILGDNVFDTTLSSLVENSMTYPAPDRAYVVLKDVGSIEEAKRFGVVKQKSGVIERIIEKPSNPPSTFVVTGLYLYPVDVFEFVKTLTPSARGELEVTDINNMYVEAGRLTGFTLHKDVFWSDCGTPSSMVRTILWEHNKRAQESLDK